MNHADAAKREISALSDSERQRFERIRAAQIAKHGSEMPEQLHGALHTIRRASYQQQASESIKEGNFAHFRDARLNMAVLLEEEVELDEELLRRALATHLEVCYLDLTNLKTAPYASGNSRIGLHLLRAKALWNLILWTLQTPT